MISQFPDDLFSVVLEFLFQEDQFQFAACSHGLYDKLMKGIRKNVFNLNEPYSASDRASLVRNVKDCYRQLDFFMDEDYSDDIEIEKNMLNPPSHVFHSTSKLYEKHIFQYLLPPEMDKPPKLSLDRLYSLSIQHINGHIRDKEKTLKMFEYFAMKNQFRNLGLKELSLYFFDLLDTLPFIPNLHSLHLVLFETLTKIPNEYDLINRQLVDDLYVQVVDVIQKLFLHIENHQLSFGIGVKNGFKEVVQRQALRYEVKLTELIPLLSTSTSGSELPNLLSQIELNSDLTSIVQKLFPSAEDSDYRIIHQSCVISYPGTEEQSWHSDGPHVSVTEYLPCHVFNVFIPLVDLTEELGPTEIRPESHHYTNNLTKGMLLAKLKKQIKAPVKPIVKKGSILIFDYRVLHKGCANKSNEVRPILVFTFAKSWYKDNLNFPSRSVFSITSNVKEEEEKGET
eukprot:gene200-209_t